MAQFELIMFATDVEVQRINDARAGRPRDYFLSLFFTDLEVVIKEPSWINRQGFPAFADGFNREIREFDFFASPVSHTRAVRRLLLGCRMSAADGTC